MYTIVLLQSIECGRFEITMRLTKLSTSSEAVTMRNQRGRTPLHLAAQLNDVETAIELLQIGAAIDDRDIVSHMYTYRGHVCTVHVYMYINDNYGGLIGIKGVQ